MKISVYVWLNSLLYILHIVSKSICGDSRAKSIGTDLGVTFTVGAPVNHRHTGCDESIPRGILQMHVPLSLTL